tara:strand:+ start:469 stop:1863 length:1395 start_codon:yes stop_codon:yes gene_type:complete
MAAIITDKLKNLVVDLIKANDSDASNKYYAAIGRSEAWNDSDVSPTPLRTKSEENRLRNSMQSMKLIADVSLVIPRYNWSSGTFYSAYDDTQVGQPTNAYYVINANQQVYMVLRASVSATGTAVASTVEPTGNTTGTPFKTSDGYVWKFMYSVSATDANKFQSANFIPVKLIPFTNINSSVAEVEQKAVQDAAVHGQIIGYGIESAGAGYGSAPTLTVKGNGTNAVATATISGGQVVKVEVADSSDASLKVANFGSGYDFANVEVSGGGTPTKPAKIRPILATNGGLGHDATIDFKASAIMFNAKPSGTETLDFIIGQDFRQVGLIKNPQTDSAGHGGNGVSTAFTASTGRALKGLNFSAVNTAFGEDKTILGVTSGAKAFIDKDSGNSVFYHQNDDTGFRSFQAGETVNETDGTGTGVLDSAGAFETAFEVNPHTGELLYIDNRSAVTRSADQTEDIKIVIQV